jgi:hypothetical protein
MSAGTPGGDSPQAVAPGGANTSSDSVRSSGSGSSGIQVAPSAEASAGRPAAIPAVASGGRDFGRVLGTGTQDTGTQSGSGPSTTPWTRPRLAGSRVSAPQGADRGGPPRSQARQVSRKLAKKATAQPYRGPLDTQAMRLARDLARKFGVEVLGFGSPGLDEEAAAEFAAAIDDVLTRHPALVLTAVAIAELSDGELIRSSVDESGDGISRIRVVLSLVAACDSSLAAERITALRRAGSWSVAIDGPPVYTLVVRELGHAMDAVGGYRARAAAREMSIADRTNGSVEPAAAVADAFVEVQLAGEAAAPQAKALYRVLLEALGNARRTSESP